MRAIDTNILVRLLVEDDTAQATIVRGIFAAGDVFIPTTVLLETAWVLGSVYRVPPDRVRAALEATVALDGVTVESPETARLALAQAATGMDIADAFHLAASRTCTAMLTFDRRFAEAGASASPPVRVPA